MKQFLAVQLFALCLLSYGLNAARVNLKTSLQTENEKPREPAVTTEIEQLDLVSKKHALNLIDEREVKEMLDKREWHRLVAMLQFAYYKLEPQLSEKCRHLMAQKSPLEAGDADDSSILVKLKSLYLFLRYPQLRQDKRSQCSQLVHTMRSMRKYIVILEMRYAHAQQLVRQQQRRIVRTSRETGMRYEIIPMTSEENIVIMSEEEKRELVDIAGRVALLQGTIGTNATDEEPTSNMILRAGKQLRRHISIRSIVKSRPQPEL